MIQFIKNADPTHIIDSESNKGVEKPLAPRKIDNRRRWFFLGSNEKKDFPPFLNQKDVGACARHPSRPTFRNPYEITSKELT